jgi:hypothetical protein
MTKLSNEEELVISRLAEAILRELMRHKITLFGAKPTVYVVVGDERLHVSLADEGKPTTEVRLTTKKEIREFGFFVNRFMLSDFLSMGDSYMDAFADSKVQDYLGEMRESNAYSRNLQRADSLRKDGYYYAAQVMLVSAFEVASRDIFFRNSGYWFTRLTFPHEELYRKFGAELARDEQDNKYRIQVNLGSTRYGFDDSNYDNLKRWESVLLNDEILSICRQLGVYEEYFQKLYGNSFQEIGHYEILKYVLQNSRRRPIDFQTLDGTGGVKWSFKRFFDMNLEKLPAEMRILKECFQKRHQIIHGELDDNAVGQDEVSELDAAVRKVFSYVHDELMSWEWILD